MWKKFAPCVAGCYVFTVFFAANGSATKLDADDPHSKVEKGKRRWGTGKRGKTTVGDRQTQFDQLIPLNVFRSARKGSRLNKLRFETMTAPIAGLIAELLTFIKLLSIPQTQSAIPPIKR